MSKLHRSANWKDLEFHGLHDEELLAIHIKPGSRGKHDGAVILEFDSNIEDRRYSLTFGKCETILFKLDFRELSINSPINTNWIQVVDNEDRINQATKRHRKAIELTKTTAAVANPKRNTHLLYRVFLFGGTLEIVADGHRLRNTGNRKRTTITAQKRKKT